MTTDAESSATRPGTANLTTLARWLSALSSVLALSLISATLFHSLLHLRDSSSMTFADGIWVGLAFWANQGVLYPPIYDGQHFAGTRYMAIPILAHAGMARMTGQWIAAVNINYLVWTSALLTILFLSLLRLRCSPAIALTLCACVLISVPGRLVTFTARNDSLPVFLQLSALLLVARSQAKIGFVGGAGVLSALAVMSKISAVWGGLAIASSLVLRRDTRGLLWFVSAAAIARRRCLGFVLVPKRGSDRGELPRVHIPGVRSPSELGALPAGYRGYQLYNGCHHFPPTNLWLLAPLALTRIALAVCSRRVTPYDLAFLICGLVTCVQFGSEGVAENHLIDMACLVLLSVGALWAPYDCIDASATHKEVGASARPCHLELATEHWIRPLIAVTTIWGILTVIVAERFDKVLLGEVRTARGDAGDIGFEPGRWPDSFPGSPKIISEDATLPVVLGQSFAVLDPYLLARYEHLYPEWYCEFVDRVRRGDYPLLVLLQDLHKPSPPEWYEISFGIGLKEVFLSRYRFKEKLGRFFIYELDHARDG